MVAFADYKSEARSRGALALELYVAQSTPIKPPEQIKAMLPDHLAYQAELERDGKLALAGPLSTEDGEEIEGMGLIIYRAESLEVARALAEADPMHETGTRGFILRRWLINEGSLTLGVGLSTKGVTLS